MKYKVELFPLNNLLYDFTTRLEVHQCLLLHTLTFFFVSSIVDFALHGANLDNRDNNAREKAYR